MSLDDNYLYLKNNNIPYVWNFTNTVDNNIFSTDNTTYDNNISNLKTDLVTENTIKAYGKISKFICSGTILKGTGVRLINKVVNDINTLCVETYTKITSVSEEKKGAAFLGIALNDADSETTLNTVYVCTNGITTIKIGNTVSNIKCGSYGVLSFTSENGEIISLGTEFSIGANTPVAGYFLEDITTQVIKDSNILFYVKGNFEFR